jgi:hypothetical protein
MRFTVVLAKARPPQVLTLVRFTYPAGRCYSEFGIFEMAEGISGSAAAFA